MGDPSRTDDLGDLDLFREYSSTRRRSTRNLLVERHLGLAVHIAQRFGGSGVAREDLQQVAMLGLVKAVERFDPDYGAPFSAFAGKTIEGELKRHFRDRGWMVRVPRSAHELNGAVRRATSELTQRHGRSPTVDEVASHLGLDRDDVLRGIAAAAATQVESLTDDEGGTDRQASIATDDHGFQDVEDASVVAALLRRLPDRQREIVRLRFYEQMSQSEIADVVGVSQMHVSRLLQQSFTQMREWMTEMPVADGGK